LVDGGLEAGEVHHDVRRADLADLRRGQLQVVRLGRGRGEVVDRDEVTADLLRDVLQGVERREDGHAVLPAASAAGAARLLRRAAREGRCARESESGEGGAGGAGRSHENDSHRGENRCQRAVAERSVTRASVREYSSGSGPGLTVGWAIIVSPCSLERPPCPTSQCALRRPPSSTPSSRSRSDEVSSSRRVRSTAERVLRGTTARSAWSSRK